MEEIRNVRAHGSNSSSNLNMDGVRLGLGLFNRRSVNIRPRIRAVRHEPVSVAIILYVSRERTMGNFVVSSTSEGTMFLGR